MGRPTLLRHASLLSCNETPFEDRLAQLRRELVERYLNKYLVGALEYDFYFPIFSNIYIYIYWE